MTLYELVERERRHVRGREVIAGALLVGGAAALIISIGAGVLGGSRWLALPRVVPFLVWALVLAAAAALAWRTRRRLHRDATRAQVAHAIEAEQRLRRGVLLGALELEGHGALAERAAAAARGTLPDDGAQAPRSPPGSCSFPRRRCSATDCVWSSGRSTRGGVRSSLAR
jgi:membrane protein implicated in regulation of membrane protease activity